MRSRFGIRELTITLSLAVACAAADEKNSKEVQAKEPTVVTVRGKQDQVRPETSQTGPVKEQNVFGKAVHGVGKGFAAVGKGFYKWLDGNFNDDVIPAPKEQNSKRARETR